MVEFFPGFDLVLDLRNEVVFENLPFLGIVLLISLFLIDHFAGVLFRWVGDRVRQISTSKRPLPERFILVDEKVSSFDWFVSLHIISQGITL